MVSIDRSREGGIISHKDENRKKRTLLMTAKVKGSKPHISNRQFLGSYTSTLVSLLFVQIILHPTIPMPSIHPVSCAAQHPSQTPSTPTTRAPRPRGELKWTPWRKKVSRKGQQSTKAPTAIPPSPSRNIANKSNTQDQRRRSGKEKN